jgi:nucleoside-diphosphate-sugar epimerase
VNILVTGHKGESGSVIMNSLNKAGHSCTSYEYKDNLDFVDAVVHTAAKHPRDEVDNIFSSNILYHKKVVDDCRMLNSKIFFLSSVSVYSDDACGEIDENYCTSATSFYGMSKIFGERYIHADGVEGYALRLPGILSIKDRTNLMGRILERLVNDKEIILINSKNPFNSYIDPEDISKFVDFNPIKKGFHCINFAVQPCFSLYETVCMLREMVSSKSSIKRLTEDGCSKFYNTDKLKRITGFETTHPKYSLENWVNRIKRNKLL